MASSGAVRAPPAPTRTAWMTCAMCDTHPHYAPVSPFIPPPGTTTSLGDVFAFFPLCSPNSESIVDKSRSRPRISMPKIRDARLGHGQEQEQDQKEYQDVSGRGVVPRAGMNRETGAQRGCVSHIAHVIHAVVVGTDDVASASPLALHSVRSRTARKSLTFPHSCRLHHTSTLS